MNKYLICYKKWTFAYGDKISVYFTKAETMKQAIENFRKHYAGDDILAISVLDDSVELQDIDT